jgi:hypothetical protein
VIAPQGEVLLVGVHHVPSRVLAHEGDPVGAPPRYGPGVYVEVTLEDDPLDEYGPVYAGRSFDAETGELLVASAGGPLPGVFRSRLKAPMRRFWSRETLGAAPMPEELLETAEAGRRR